MCFGNPIICILLHLGDLERRQKNSRAGMTPTLTQSLMDNKITLHDEVFMDNSDDEPKLEKILKLHEEVHCELIPTYKIIQL